MIIKLKIKGSETVHTVNYFHLLSSLVAKKRAMGNAGHKESA